jgi:5-methylcytosine-specific restriction endonuclease McrA
MTSMMTRSRVKKLNEFNDRMPRQERLERIIVRDRGCCQICGYYIHDKSQITLDHIQPKQKNGPTTFDNLQLAHKKCNSEKGCKWPRLNIWVDIEFERTREYNDYIIINAS